MPSGEVEERAVGDGLHKPVAKEIKRQTSGSDGLAVRHSFLKLDVGKGAARADGTVIDQSASGNDGLPIGNGDAGILKLAVRPPMPDTKLRHLAHTASSGVLMALAARLGIVNRAKPVANVFDFVELRLIGCVGSLINQPVGLAVKTVRRFSATRKQCTGHNETKRQYEPEPHKFSHWIILSGCDVSHSA